MFSSSDDSGLDASHPTGMYITPQLNTTKSTFTKPVPPETKGLTKLGHYIAEASNESESKIIVKATHILGRERSLKYLEFAHRTQGGNGGFLITDGTRLRTIGGMFLRLIKDDPDITKQEIDAIFKKQNPYSHTSKKSYLKSQHISMHTSTKSQQQPNNSTISNDNPESTKEEDQMELLCNGEMTKEEFIKNCLKLIKKGII